MKIKQGVARLCQDSLGNNIGGFLFEAMGRYMRVPLITNNPKFNALNSNTVTIDEVTQVDELIMVNPYINFFGGKVPKTLPHMIDLILNAKRVIVYITDPKLMPKIGEYKKVKKLDKAMERLVNAEYVFNYQTDFLKFYYATKKVPLINSDYTLEKEGDKAYDVVYFGNRRSNKRQAQLNSYLNQVKQDRVLIVGWDHEWYDSMPYSKDFFKSINKAWVTPIIGDEKIHYSKHTRTTRLYESWFTTTIGLVDSRFGFEYPKELITSPKTFVDDMERVKDNHEKYFKMQRNMLSELKSEFKDVYFNLKTMKQCK